MSFYGKCTLISFEDFVLRERSFGEVGIAVKSSLLKIRYLLVDTFLSMFNSSSDDLMIFLY